MKLSILSFSVGLACLVAVPLGAANLVLDPGFEAGGAVTCNGAAVCGPIHPAWTFTDAASGTDYGVDTSNQHSGTNAFFFAGTTAGSYDAIQQALSTTPGQFYTLTFWLNTSFNHSDADFQVFWNGTMIYDDPAGVDIAHQFPYTQLSFGSLQATGSSTVLEFDGYNVPSGDYLDDIAVDSAVASVPEPASWVLICAGALLLFLRVPYRFGRA
jgi:hypothetical protein